MAFGGEPGGFSLLITDFVQRVPGVTHGIVVSGEGTLLGVSLGLAQARADQLWAIASGLFGMTAGAAHCVDAGKVYQTVVEMQRGYLLLMAAPDGGCLAVLASPACDMGTVAYELRLLVDRVDTRFV